MLNLLSVEFDAGRELQFVAALKRSFHESIAENKGTIPFLIQRFRSILPVH